MTQQVRASHVWTAAGLLAGGIAAYVAFVTPPEVTMQFRDALKPDWVSFGYPRDAVIPGKFRQTLLIFAVLFAASAVSWHAAGALLRRNAARVFPIAVAVTSLLIGAFVVVFGNRHFGAVDEALAIDVGWRLVSGQQPYRDFICTLPPGFFLPPKWAFQLLGVSWSSLTMLTAAFAALTFAWQAALLRRILDHAAAAILVAATCQSLAVLIASFWWYNPVTATAGVIYVLSALLLLRAGPRGFALVSYTVSLVLLASVKPNVAGLLIAGGTVILLTSKAHRLRVIASSAIAFVLFVAILALHSISLAELLGSYLSIAGRGAPSASLAFHDVNWVERTEAAIAILLALSPLAFLRRRVDWRTAALLLLSMLTGAYAILAHGELKYLDAPFLLLPAVIAIFASGSKDSARQWALAACVTLMLLGLTLGAMRQRVERIGFGAFFEWELDERAPRSELFRSLRTGPRFHAVESQVAQFLGEIGDARVFFGIRLEPFYAAAKRESPRGFPPLLWHRNTFHPISREPELIEPFRRGEFDVLVFLHRDFTHFPMEAREAILKNYLFSREHMQRYPQLTVLFSRRRYGSAANERAQLGRDVVPHRAGQAGVNADP